MADLLRTKLLHCRSFSFPPSCSPHPFIIRFASLRRCRPSRSSSLLANRLGIISTAEQADGSVVFKFGDLSETETSQTVTNVNGSDVQSDKISVFDDERNKSELVATADAEYEVSFESDSVREIAESHKTEALNSKGDDNHSIGVEGSTVNENDGTEQECLTESKIEILLEENSSISAETSNLTATSDSNVDLVVEGSNDSELVMHEIFVATSNCSETLIAEKLKEMGSNGEVATAVSTSQLELSGSELLEISEKTSYLEPSELVASQVANNAHNLFHKEVAESCGTSSPIEASVMTSSLGDVELDINGKHMVNEEDGDNAAFETAQLCSAIEALDTTVSSEDDRHHTDTGVEQLANEEHDENDSLETNSPIGASDTVQSLDDGKHNIDVTNVVNVEDDNNDMPEIKETNLGIEASEIAVPLESDVTQVVNEKYGGNGVLEIAQTNSPIEVTNIAVSLEEDEHDKDAKQVTTVEDDDNDVLDAAEANSCIEPSEIAVSLEDDKHVNIVEESVNEEYGDYEQTAERNSAIEALDGKSILQEIASINSVIEASDIAVSLEGNEIDSNVKQEPKEDDINGKLHKIGGADSLVETSDVVDGEFDRNEKHALNEVDDLVELMDKPVPQETQPILDEEAKCKSEEDFVALEPISGSNMVDEAAALIIAQSDDDLSGVDSLEAASPESSEIAVAEANVDSERSTESTSPTFNVFSAAASLPHPGEALTGAEDACFVCQKWFGLADGVGQWSLTGTDTGRYSQELMRNLEKLASNTLDAGSTDVKEVLQKIADATEFSGSARVLIAHFSNQTLHVANIGDTGFVIIRHGAIFKKSTPIVHEFNFPCAIGFGVDPLEAVEEYHIQLEDGDVIIAATDGLFDNLYEQEIASIVSKSVDAGMKPKELAEVLVKKAQEVGSLAYGRSPFADAAQAAGHAGVIGGKLDHVTVIVSFVQIK